MVYLLRLTNIHILPSVVAAVMAMGQPPGTRLGYWRTEADVS